MFYVFVILVVIVAFFVAIAIGPELPGLVVEAVVHIGHLPAKQVALIILVAAGALLLLKFALRRLKKKKKK